MCFNYVYFLYQYLIDNCSGDWIWQKDVRWPCGVCTKDVGSNSIQCSSCQKWVHKKCSGIKGSMSKVAKSFICRRCLNPVTSAGRTSVDIGASAKLELVDKFLPRDAMHPRY